jgi:hypothetical protein
MQLRLGRIIAAAIAVEVLAILVLVLLVALVGPADQAAAEAYAERLGYWVGPIAGFVLCLVGGWWVAKRLSASHMVNGLALGVTVAVIDIVVLFASGAEFHPIFAVSNIGRVVAGTIGGWLAGRSGRAEEIVS